MGLLASFIIPTYGRPAFIRDAVDSVLNQTVRDLECIVVDDASPSPVDLPGGPRLRVIRRPVNGGAAAARNTGIQASQGVFLTFLDDDDLVTPDRLEIGLRGVDRAPVGLCLLASLEDPSTGPGRRVDGDVSGSIAAGLVPNVGQALVRRTAVERFDERFRACEDIDWWIRMAQRGPLALEPQVGYLFRHHDGPRHGNELAARVSYRRELLMKHREYFRSHPRAEAFQLRRIGLAEAQLGRRRDARAALRRAMRRSPALATARDLARTLGTRSSKTEDPPGDG
jgi:glycosyltransferase involved in cell wall biosynthesis